MKDTFLRHPCRNPQEPDFVAELVNRLPRYIYNTLSVYVPHYKYAISGIILPSETIS